MGTHAQRRTRRDPDLWNRMVNDKFNGEQPVLSPEESLAAAKKLYRHATGKSWRGEWELTSGNRRTWVRYDRRRRKNVFYVNPDERRFNARGLREIIHSISHYVHWRQHPEDKPHSIRQARLEAKLAKFAVERNCWMDGSLKKAEVEEKPKPDLVKVRYDRILARAKKWEKQTEHAKKMHEKAVKEMREYARRHGERVTA